MQSGERGIALVEVLAAVLILSAAGLGLVELTGALARDVTAAAEREQVLADEERLLASFALLDRPGLVSRLGARAIGAYTVTVQRPERDLYRLSIARRQAPGVEDLVTVLFRPDIADAP